jgi:hypothetical protein
MRLLVILAALGVLAAGCTVCGLINQDIVVDSNDPDLGGLISDCMNDVPPPSSFVCLPQPKTATTAPAIVCACLPLCERVFAIVNPDPKRPPLQKCSMFIDSITKQAHVGIEYRSVCQ